MKKEGDKFTVTVQKQNPGIYGYKYKIGTSWITDPANDAMTDGNSRLVFRDLNQKIWKLWLVRISNFRKH